MAIDWTTTKKAIPLVLVAVLGCGGPASRSFDHEFVAGATPWANRSFDDGEGKFTFAIFADRYSGERAGVFDVAIAQLSLLRPELILTVGDLIDGGTEDRARLAQEWDAFDGRAARAAAPVFRVGGNHDLTNQTMRDVWGERYGSRYYHFVYKNVLFLILDTEDYTADRMREIYLARAAALKALDAGDANAQQMAYFQMPERVTGEIGPEQSRYFLDVLARYPDVRWTMLFMHKPVWQRTDEPEFAAIESALATRPYTVFNGHFHRYAHTERHERDYIMLGTTSGGQSPTDDMAFDHVSLVTMTGDGPAIAQLRLDGILDRTGHVPLGGDSLCFRAARCGPSRAR